MVPLSEVRTPRLPGAPDVPTSASFVSIVAPLAASKLVTPVPVKSRSTYVAPEPESNRTLTRPADTLM